MERFWAKVLKTEDCWIWNGAVSGGTGYGNLTLGGRPMSAHRASWILHFGEIPEGAWVLHRCDNRRCVRPDHLFLGDGQANYKDMIEKGRQRHVSWNALKTHCKRGHEFTVENTEILRSGWRRCRACHREQAAAYRKENPEWREIARRANAKYRAKKRDVTLG